MYFSLQLVLYHLSPNHSLHISSSKSIISPFYQLSFSPLSPHPAPPLHPLLSSAPIFLVRSHRSLLQDAGRLAVSCILARVKCHKVPFSICLFHATLHQPLTCGSHVVQEGGRFIQSKSGWKLTLIFPFLRKDCGKRQFHDHSAESEFFVLISFLCVFNVYTQKQGLKHVVWDLNSKYNILISPICFCFVFFISQWIQSDPPQFTACNIHSWSIDCYSSGNYLKRESSCAFLMDCACLPLLYMDRELVWRSVILFSQSLPSALLFGGEEYLQSSLHIFQVLLRWLGWMTLTLGGDESLWAAPLSSFLGEFCHEERQRPSPFKTFHVK